MKITQTDMNERKLETKGDDDEGFKILYPRGRRTRMFVVFWSGDMSQVTEIFVLSKDKKAWNLCVNKEEN